MKTDRKVPPGAITTSGRQVFFETARGAVNDLINLSAGLGGSTYSINLGSAPSSQAV
jgi:hypothetical protein